MKFGHPLLTSELSGSIGGVTAANARGGVGYFRVRARPSNPRSFAQTTMRAVLTTLAAGWALITGPQRTAWSSIAPANSSGIDAYVKGNTNPILFGDPATAAAPASLALPDSPIIASVVADASSHNITLPSPVPTDIAVNIFVSRPQHASRGAQQFGFTYAGAAAEGDTFVALPTTHPAYNMAAGQVVYIRLVYFGRASTTFAGQVATGQEFRAIVQA